MLGRKCQSCGMEAWLADAGQEKESGRFFRTYVCDNGHKHVVWTEKETAERQEQAYELARLRRLNRLLRRRSMHPDEDDEYEDDEEVDERE